MPYTFFQQCYKVLDMHKIPAETLDNRRLSMKREWYETPIDFSNQVTQCAYIRTDVPFHANVRLQIIKEHPELGDLFQEVKQEIHQHESAQSGLNPENREDLNVMSIGCGPGTDMLALVKYIFNEKNTGNKKLRLFLTDDEPAWEKMTDQFEMLIHEFQKRRSRKINFSKEFQVWKILDGEISLPEIVSTRLRNTNLFIFNLFFSNLASQNDAQKETAVILNLEKMLSGATEGAIFLFIDIDQEYVKWLRQMCDLEKEL